jgi:hypothetical protein
MLPPNLARLKDTLTLKGYAQRSSGEDAILKELQVLDASSEVNETVQEAIANRQLDAAGIFSGPTGSCPCCGKSV